MKKMALALFFGMAILFGIFWGARLEYSKFQPILLYKGMVHYDATFDQDRRLVCTAFDNMFHKYKPLHDLKNSKNEFPGTGSQVRLLYLKDNKFHLLEDVGMPVCVIDIHTSDLPKYPDIRFIDVLTTEEIDTIFIGAIEEYNLRSSNRKFYLDFDKLLEKHVSKRAKLSGEKAYAYLSAKLASKK